MSETQTMCILIIVHVFCNVQTEEFAREVLKENDASHDYQHVDRVRNLALSLARNEGLVESTNTSRLDEEMVALCALLHDVDDWKYKKPGEEHESKAQAFLQRMVLYKHNTVWSLS